MKTHIQNLLVVLAWSAGILQAAAQGTTAFTYQGQLQCSGTNVNGACTMIFKLYDAVSAGNQIGNGITNNPILSNGLFSVNLDFGAGAFNGSARWLDIAITNSGTFQELSPRAQVLPAPYAQYAEFAAGAATVTNGGIMNAQLAANAVNATNIAGGQVVKNLNGLMDNVVLSAGANVALATNGNTLQISAPAGGGVIAAGNNVGFFTNSAVIQISSFVPNIQYFKLMTNATFTVPTNVTRIMVEMWGAGGGGGAGNSTGLTIGGGGGAGAYAWNVFTVTNGTSYLITTGAGGNGGVAGVANGIAGATSSFGALMSAGGGSGGGNATSGSAGTGGAGGTASGSIYNVQGSGGDNNGNGGGVWRGGGTSLQGGNGGAQGPGSGGSGGAPSNSGRGGNAGIVIVYY